LSLSKTLVGFVQYKVAECLSPNTLLDYERHIKASTDYLQDPQVDKACAQESLGFFVWLSTDYEPMRLTGGHDPLSPKTCRNIWATLRSFFSWVSEQFGLPNPMDAVKAPKLQHPPVEPFTETRPRPLSVGRWCCR
jgi:site-specific recombinase XerD